MCAFIGLNQAVTISTLCTICAKTGLVPFNSLVLYQMSSCPKTSQSKLDNTNTKGWPELNCKIVKQ